MDGGASGVCVVLRVAGVWGRLWSFSFIVVGKIGVGGSGGCLSVFLSLVFVLRVVSFPSTCNVTSGNACRGGSGPGSCRTVLGTVIDDSSACPSRCNI